MSGFAAIGEAMIELSDPQDGRWKMGFAGDSLNTAWYIRALLPDQVVDFVSAFGDDSFSAAQRDFLATAAIGTAASPVIQGARPGLYAITLHNAERSFTYWRSDSAARALASDRDALRASLAGREMIFVTGITLAILSPVDRIRLLEALAEARAKGARIAFDPNHRPKLWPDASAARAAYQAIYGLCDIVLPTREDEADLFGDASSAVTAARIAGYGVAEVVVKCGADPAQIYAGGDHHAVPALKVSAVDTTGAGDSFCGGYLAARMQGQSPFDAACLGHRVAAKVVCAHGALLPLATFAGFAAG